MKPFLFVSAMLCFAGCATHRPVDAQAVIAAASPIDEQVNPSIEDYILALPPYSFHEAPIAKFAETVKGARSLPQNKGKGPDYLYCPGDGTWPAKEFMLKRSARRLRITIHPVAEPGAQAYTVTMQRVTGGWR